MAGTSLLMLIDDIASILDDVSVMSQMAAKKTAGVIGDDLALNAYQVNGVNPERELPVVAAVAKGSLVNKAILVPTAITISAFAPWAVQPLLMLGGAFLCFEGAEKLVHRYLHGAAEAVDHAETLRAAADEDVDLVAHEKEKIRGAIRTDFVLSAEIIIITLGVVADDSLLTQVMVLTAIAVLMTVGVYGLVAAIVKFDDLGLYLTQRTGDGSTPRILRACGRGILFGAPWLLKGLTVVGTIAMFLVGGGILVHGIPALGHAIESVLPHGILGTVLSGLVSTVGGVVTGLVLTGVALLVAHLRGDKSTAAAAGSDDPPVG